MAKELPGYGEVIFPHCPCDSRKSGHVMAAVGYLGLRLIACTDDGTLEVIIQLNYITIIIVYLICKICKYETGKFCIENTHLLYEKDNIYFI